MRKPQQQIPAPRDRQIPNHIVFDTESNQWYNKQTDIFLSDDDLAYHMLTNNKPQVTYLFIYHYDAAVIYKELPPKDILTNALEGDASLFCFENGKIYECSVNEDYSLTKHELTPDDQTKTP